MTILSSRRRFLSAVLAALGVGTLSSSYWWFRPLRMHLVPITATERDIVEKLIDQFVPRDETVGALDLKIQHALLAEAGKSRVLGRLLAEACYWLDRQADLRCGCRFLDLPAADADALLALMAEQAPSSAEWKSFWWLRDGTMERYYQRPETWLNVGLSGPPQPDGYLDYRVAPGLSPK